MSFPKIYHAPRITNPKVAGSILDIDREFSEMLYTVLLPPPSRVQYWFFPEKMRVLILLRRKVAWHPSLIGNARKNLKQKYNQNMIHFVAGDKSYLTNKLQQREWLPLAILFTLAIILLFIKITQYINYKMKTRQNPVHVYAPI